MLKTILLLDGSEAMNNASDYLPSYLLAMRPPLLRFMVQYLDATPLASLGVVVMRNGIAERLCPCTTNVSELADTLERDYFLYGGAGATSLENGLRMALSELVDLKKMAAAGVGAASPGVASPQQQSGVAQLRAVIVSASVTFIDPTDIFRVMATMAAFRVVVDVVSLTGAVHVFDECARQTGGRLHCPLGFDHLLETMHLLAVGRAGGGRRKRRRAGGGGEDDNYNSNSTVGKAPMVPIGFPVYLRRRDDNGGNESAATTTATTHYLACPQCHLIQTSIPSTCPLCKLLLCNVCLTYATFVAHNGLAPPSTPVPTRRLLLEEQHCGLCGVHGANPREGGTFHRCNGCRAVRCTACDVFVKGSLGLCPGCVAAK